MIWLAHGNAAGLIRRRFACEAEEGQPSPEQHVKVGVTVEGAWVSSSMVAPPTVIGPGSVA